jgi:hypothetical protein
MSSVVSSGWRPDPTKANCVPSGLNAGHPDAEASLGEPSVDVATKDVTPVPRSRTYRSMSAPFGSTLLVRFVALLSKATLVPSGLITGFIEWAFPGALPIVLTETRLVSPVRRSRTKTSIEPLVSLGTRSLAWPSNTTLVPSALMVGSTELRFPPLPPPRLMLTSSLRHGCCGMHPAALATTTARTTATPPRVAQLMDPPGDRR